jgi:hypothetical protein
MAYVCGYQSLPIGDLTTAATIVPVLSVLLNVCYTGYYLLWIMAGSGHDWMAIIALSSFSPWRVGPSPVAILACLPHQARVANQEV